MRLQPKILTTLLASTLLTYSLHGYQKLDNHKPCPVLCPISPLDAKEDCCHNIHLDIGLLYMQPTLSNMSSGKEAETLRDDVIDGKEYEDFKTTDLLSCLDYALGVTASLGHLSKHDDWYLGTRFDYLSASGWALYDLTEEPSKDIFFTFPWQGSEEYSSYDNMEWFDDERWPKVEYTASADIYILDTLVSRGSFHSKNFSYEPFAGIKAVWYYTEVHKDYFISDENGFYLQEMKNWGAGPMFGFNGEYALSCCMSIFSDSDIALLYGESILTRSTVYNDYDDNILDRVFTSLKKDNITCAIYVPIRSCLGLKFSRYFFEDKHFFALKIGYDVRAIAAFPDTTRGLYLNGLYTNLIWNF